MGLIVLVTTTTTYVLSRTVVVLLQRALCLLDGLVVPVYVLLSALAPLALVGDRNDADDGGVLSSSSLTGFFHRLAAHGKALQLHSSNGSSRNNGIQPSFKKSSLQSLRRSTTTTTRTRRWWGSSLTEGWVAFNDWLFRRDSDGRGGGLYVPKRYFSHFYAVGMFQLLVCVSLLMTRKTTDESGSIEWYSSPRFAIVWGLLGLHLVRRYYECLRVHRWTSHSQMHLAGYVLGILHYVLLPFVFCPFSDAEEATLMPAAPSISTPSSASKITLSGQMICVALCLFAQYQQHRHHHILANLRALSSSSSSSRGASRTVSSASSTAVANYAIPTGRWFRFVSSPHYLAEIVVYVSLVALAVLVERGSGASTTSWQQQRWRYVVLLVWVVDNLTVSALSTHRWYLRQFPDDYVKLNRKAIFPHLL